jgi:4-hydroxy-3-polyprenylbenzoate decarboxylase
MAINNLREWIEKLESCGQLARIDAAISAELEITEIVDRVSKGRPETNRALLFENVSGYDVPVLINAFGSAERMALALGVSELDELNRKLSALIDMRLPRGLRDTLARGSDLFAALTSVGLKPKKVRRAPVQEVVRTGSDARIDFLPVLKCYP